MTSGCSPNPIPRLRNQAKENTNRNSWKGEPGAVPQVEKGAYWGAGIQRLFYNEAFTYLLSLKVTLDQTPSQFQLLLEKLPLDISIHPHSQ